MKILRVVQSLDPRHGGPVSVAKLMDAELSRLGHHVEVINLGAAEEAVDYPVQVHSLGPSAGAYRFNKIFKPWMDKNATRFDAILVDGLWQYQSFGTWRSLRRSDSSYFVLAHGMLDPWFKQIYPLKHLKKWLYWPWAEYRVLRDASGVIFTSEEERLASRESFWLYRCKEYVLSLGTRVPPPGKSDRKKEFISAFPVLDGKRVLLFLGRLHPIKGCEELIESFSRVANLDPRLHLVIAGPDEAGVLENYQCLAEKLEISDRLTWSGMLAGDMKWGAIEAAEALVLASHHENFGMVVAEALGCGRPVIISDKVNIWREIQEDRAGIIGSDTVEGMEVALREWLEMTNDERETICRAAIVSFEKRFRIQDAACRLLDILSNQGL